MDENGNRTCKTVLVGLGAVAVVALLVSSGYSAMKLHKLEYAVWHASIQPLTVPLPQPDKRSLNAVSGRSPMGRCSMDQSNVWIIIDATNELKWIAVDNQQQSGYEAVATGQSKGHQATGITPTSGRRKAAIK